MILAFPVSLDFVSELGQKVPTLPVITVLVPNWKQKSKVYLILNSCIGLGLKVPTLPVSIVLVPDWE